MSYVQIALQHVFLYPVLEKYMRSFELVGIENLDALSGPAIFVSNHTSHADTAVILYALPNRCKENLVIAAAQDYFYKNRIVGSVVSSVLNTFPFDRNNIRKGFSAARKLLREGNSLLIYPEGSRAQQAKGFKRGFALLAAEQGLPIVPIYISGTNEMLPKGALFPRRQSVRIEIGQPVYPSNLSNKALAHLVEERVGEMEATSKMSQAAVA
mgnify:CR=1 FL=1